MEVKDLGYWKANAEEDYLQVPISVLRYITELERVVENKWKSVFEEIPPSNIELLAESPDGLVHLTDWRDGYQIFSCQCKSESSRGWKWKAI